MSSGLKLPLEFTSERLTLRAPCREAGPLLNEAARESYDELAPWMPWVHPFPSVQDSEDYGEKGRANYEEGTKFPLQLFLKETGQFVGSSGIHPHNWEVPTFEIGYWIRTSLTGQGYATETVLAIINIARVYLRARRVEIRMDSLNEKSWRVAERAGFELEGILRHERRGLTGGLRDTRVYAKIWPDET